VIETGAPIGLDNGTTVGTTIGVTDDTGGSTMVGSDKGNRSLVRYGRHSEG
jgi:hypothetical protein